jgi:hypothetical protein
MGQWIKQRLALVVIAGIAVVFMTVVATLAVMQPRTKLTAQQTTDSPTATNPPTQGAAYQANGVIESIAYDSNSTQSGKLLFLASNQQQAVTIVFSAQTTITLQDGTGATISEPLAAGYQATITGTQNADGTITASKVEASVADMATLPPGTTATATATLPPGTTPTPQPTHRPRPTPTPRPTRTPGPSPTPCPTGNGCDN